MLPFSPDTMWSSVVLLLLVLTPGSLGTACSAVTDSYCSYTDGHMTGQCGIGSECECEEGYEISIYGCKEIIRTFIVPTAIEYTEGADVTLTCFPTAHFDYYAATYTWTGVDADSTSTPNVTIYNVNREEHNGQEYTCSIMDSGINSSLPFTLIVGNDVANATKPRIVGVSENVFTDIYAEVVDVVGTNETITYQWTLDGEVVGGNQDSIVVAMYENRTALDLVVNVTVSNVGSYVSDPVQLPSEIHESATGFTVRANGGEDIYLPNVTEAICDVVSNVSNSFLMFVWYKDDALLLDSVNEVANITAAGQYHCGIFVGVSEVNSSSITVTEAPPLSSPYSAHSPLLQGTMEITCPVITPPFSLDTEISWYIDDVPLLNHIGASILISEISPTDNFTVKCSYSYAGLTMMSTGYTLDDPVNMDDVGAPTLYEAVEYPVVYYGDPFQLSCSSDRFSPGTNFIFYADAVEVTSSTSATYDGTATNETVLYTCKAEFNGFVTPEVSNSISIRGSGLPTPSISVSPSPEFGDLYTDGNVYTLTCVSPVTIDGMTYQWFNSSGDVIEGETSETLLVTAGIYTQNFTCLSTKYNDVSNLTEVEVILAKGIFSFQFLLDGSTDTPVNTYAGLLHNFSCVGDLAGDTSDTFWQIFTTDGVQINVSNIIAYGVSGPTSNISCYIKHGDHENTSNSIVFSVTDFPPPNITVSPSSEFGVYYTYGDSYTLACNSPLYYERMTYQWFDRSGGLIDNETSSTIVMIADVHAQNFTCATVVDFAVSEPSDMIIITAKGAERVLVKNGPFFLGEWLPMEDSNLTLTCEVTLVETMTEAIDYQWFVGGNMSGTGENYTFYLVSLGMNESVECQAIIGDFSAISNTVSVLSNGYGIVPLMIAQYPYDFEGTRLFLEGDTYEFVCFSPSYTIDAVFQWSRDGTFLSSITSHTYQITDVSDLAHSGNYTCEMIINNVTLTSSAFTFDVSFAGRPCSANANCTDLENANRYTGVCNSNRERCVCSSGYSAKGSQCVVLSASPSISKSSVIAMIIPMILSQLI